MRKYHFKDGDLVNVCTQHSLCFRHSYGAYGVLGKKEMSRFCAETGWRFGPRIADPLIEEEAFNRDSLYDFMPVKTKDTEFQDDQTFFNTELARLTLKPFRDDQRAERNLAIEFKEWKERNKLIDFIGMIERAIQDEFLPWGVQAILVDEAQDMCGLLYEYHKLLINQLQRPVYWFGDEDQCVYRFLGADPAFFVNQPAEETIYGEESHRCPTKIMSFAHRIISRNENRLPKNVRGLKTDGIIEHLGSFRAAKEACAKFAVEGGWKDVLWLAPTNWQVEGIHQDLLVDKFPVKLSDAQEQFLRVAKWIEDGKEVFNMTELHELLTARSSVVGKDGRRKAQKLFPASRKFFSAPRNFYRWIEESMSGETVNCKSEFRLSDLTVSELMKDVFRLRSITLTNLDEDHLRFYETVKHRANDTYTIRCMTGHKSKGKEADAVFVDASCLGKTLESAIKDPESIRRLAFVMATRTKGYLGIYESDPYKGKNIFSFV